jgi:HEAT repeat protein
MAKRILILSVVFISCIYSQDRNVNAILDHTLSYRGLTRHDITIPIEFFSAGEKSPTNNAKLMLPLVRDIMLDPLRSMSWLDSVSELPDKKIIPLIGNLFDYINYPSIRPESMEVIYGNEPDFIFKTLRKYIHEGKNNRTLHLEKLTNEEKTFLQKNLLSIFEEENPVNSESFDIFLYNRYRDSSISISKRTMDILAKYESSTSIRYDSWYNLINSYFLFKHLSKKNIFEGTKNIQNEFVQGDFYHYYDKDGIRIAIGGPGKNIYTGDFDFIIDMGGDDVYNIDKHTPSRQGEPPHSRGELKIGGFSCIIDLSGNDYYTTSSDFALAGGLFSSSFIFDKEGDDIYESKGAGNLGAAIGGLGLLYDEKGNDTYKGISFSIGAGCFGVGLLVDREGNDFYIANSYSQGFGFTQGVGAIVDNKGNDSYLVDSRSLDIGRYNDHYVSMCQGYGLGLRPFYAGGIGLIIEGAGNDIYNTDIFGQGGAYWYSLGAIVDKSGHDKYNGYQYSQGSGIHLAVGLLKDYDGWDQYQSNGVSQGCGHDFGFGLLWDVKGNDNYSAYSLSQGAGNANGIGILIDESGTDGYLNKYPSNTRGYGNARREFGSLGIFMDVSGSDYYSQPGYDSTLINSSTWGVFNDYYYKDLPEQISGDNFKTEVDSSGKSYSISDYFIMAKTIEPRFSHWQEYGFRKLQEDSINTANYMLTKLATTDHREVQVMRVLSLRIQSSIAAALLGRLNEHLSGGKKLIDSELSMICYIFGETKDPSGKELLLQLTYENDLRVRSSAINALGKINYDKSDVVFIDKVSSRLGELAMEKTEKTDKRLYYKDIAFALGNYITPQSFGSLLYLLNMTYYGARFVAADNLKKFPQLEMMLLTLGNSPDIPKGEMPLIAFLHALRDLKDNDLQVFVSFIKMMPEYENEFVRMNMLNLLKYKSSISVEATYNEWYDNEISELEAGMIQKVK